MKYKRLTLEEVADVLTRAAPFFPSVLGGRDCARASFLGIPRFGVLIRARTDSVQAYFRYLHPRSSWRAFVYHIVLLIIVWCRIPQLARWLGLIEAVYTFETSDAGGLCDVDVLLAEWQFVGAFSFKTDTVAHILTHEKYRRCLINEIEARKELAAVVDIPGLLDARMEGANSGYVEKIVRRDRRCVEGEVFGQAQRQMLASYSVTGRRVALEHYIADLTKSVERAYVSPQRDRQLARLVESLLTILDNRAPRTQGVEIGLARCHGDFNSRQIIQSSSGMAIVDWSESEYASVFHDYVYSAIWHLGWRGFGESVHVPALEPLRRGISEEMDRFDPLFVVAIVLIEIAAKQTVDYTEKRGTRAVWVRTVSAFVETASRMWASVEGASAATESP
jgi:hypothetical protein